MDQNYYLKHAQRATEFMDDAIRSRVSWLQHILLICSAVLGLLAGLHATPVGSLCARETFVLTIILLAAGMVLGAVALYGYQVFLAQDRRQRYIDAVQDAVRKGAEVEPVFAALPKRFSLCEKICYIALLISVVSLVTYSMLLVIN